MIAETQNLLCLSSMRLSEGSSQSFLFSMESLGPADLNGEDAFALSTISLSIVLYLFFGFVRI